MFKRKSLIIVLAVIVLILGISVIFIRRQYTVPILMYHRINLGALPSDRLVVSPQTFRRQIQFLKNQRYNAITLETLADLIREKKRIPKKTIVITFDDGYDDNYSRAFPVLKEYNLPATIFVIVQEIGRPDRLSWDEVKQMQLSGLITIGSHAIGPEPLINIKSEEELKKQIFDSKKILEEKLGRPVNAFSYPEGRFNVKIRNLVIAAGYRVAVATKGNRGYPDDDIFLLKRLRISEKDKNPLIFWVKTSGLYTFFKRAP